MGKPKFTFFVIGALLLFIGAAGCSLNVNKTEGRTASKEDLMAARYILAESLSSDDSGIILSLNDALTAISEKEFIGASYSGDHSGRGNETGYTHVYRERIGLHIVTFNRKVQAAIFSKTVHDTLRYRYRTSGGTNIEFPRQKSSNIASIYYNDRREGTITALHKKSRFVRRDTFIIEDVNTSLLNINGAHHGIGTIKIFPVNGSSFKRAYKLEINLLNITASPEAFNNSSDFWKKVSGTLTWQLQLGYGSGSKRMGGTIKLSGAGMAMIIFNSGAENYKVNLNDGDLIELDEEFEGRITAVNIKKKSVTLFNGRTLYLTSNTDIEGKAHNNSAYSFDMNKGTYTSLKAVSRALGKGIKVWTEGEGEMRNGRFVIADIELQKESSEEAYRIEFDDVVTSVNVQAGTFTLFEKVRVAVGSKTSIDQEGDFQSLQEVATALKHGWQIWAKGEAISNNSTGGAGLRALEVEFEKAGKSDEGNGGGNSDDEGNDGDDGNDDGNDDDNGDDNDDSDDNGGSPTQCRVGVLYHLSGASSSLYTVNKTTGFTSLIHDFDADVYESIASDQSGTLYSINQNTNELVILGTNGVTKVIGLTTGIEHGVGMAFNRGGDLYVVDQADDHLYKINPSNGSTTDLGAIGDLNIHGGDLVSLPNSDDLLYVRASGELFVIDVATKTYTAHGDVTPRGMPNEISSAMRVGLTYYALNERSNGFITFRLDENLNPVKVTAKQRVDSYFDGDGTVCAPQFNIPEPPGGDGDDTPEQCFVSSRIATDASAIRDIQATDIDGDGDNDILLASRNNDRIAWYENTISGFDRHIIIDGNSRNGELADGAESVAAADLDGDGDVDVISASMYDNRIAWYENGENDDEENGYYDENDGDDDGDDWDDDEEDENENFKMHIVSTKVMNANFVYATDINGDGAVDIVASSRGSRSIIWFENNGREDFTAHTITTEGSSNGDTYVTDMDGDGDADIVAVLEKSGNYIINWYENWGGRFTAHQVDGFTEKVTSVFATDMDSDGDIDVMKTSAYSNTVVWYENHGAIQNFTTHVIMPAGRATAGIAADVDGDNDVDLLVAIGKIGSSKGDYVFLYENDSRQNFTPTIIGRSDYVQSIVATDLDDDNYIDVLAPSGHGSTILRFEQTCYKIFD